MAPILSCISPNYSSSLQAFFVTRPGLRPRPFHIFHHVAESSGGQCAAASIRKNHFDAGKLLVAGGQTDRDSVAPRRTRSSNGGGSTDIGMRTDPDGWYFIEAAAGKFPEDLSLV